VAYASPGFGTSPHLAAEVLQQAAGIGMSHVPYTNDAQGRADVVTGRVDVTWDFPLTAMPYLREGRLRALAVTDHARVRIAPDVPTVAECGFPGAEMVSWAGLFVPVQTAPSRIARLAVALRDALEDPAVHAAFDGSGTALWPDMDPARFGAFLAQELPRIAALVSRAGPGTR